MIIGFVPSKIHAVNVVTLVHWALVGLLGLGDGLGIILEAKSGSLELYAWSQSRLPATSGATKELNASQAGADKELSFTAAGSEDQMFTRALVRLPATSLKQIYYS
ncbi:hypothetical protein DPMN_184587 [Dreissena polymorpha]|uniref:Uncharacterized protein n=1 Tax=Dreissena polymorpha TaxID=45954 RepID=A0A9D4I4R9_DREPO|nr:hypothetical protein DPMN_184587 [Dreissena polymorpha]